MGNWDDLDAVLTGVDLDQDAGEWAVTAMACVAYADGNAAESEIDKAREIVSKTSVIRDSLGPAFGEQLFMDTIARIQASPDTEIEQLKSDLTRLAGRIKAQQHRDHAFQTLVVIATADHEILPAEYQLMVELKELIGTEVMVPMPQVSV